uniref:Uncharacterized protein n=1 Tax=Opuntia streptacantha TaxID=393608 RepID=A0A7C9EP96_OPUST
MKNIWEHSSIDCTALFSIAPYQTWIQVMLKVMKFTVMPTLYVPTGKLDGADFSCNRCALRLQSFTCVAANVERIPLHSLSKERSFEVMSATSSIKEFTSSTFSKREHIEDAMARITSAAEHIASLIP